MCEVVVAIGGWTVVFMGDETFRFMGFLVCYLFLACSKNYYRVASFFVFVRVFIVIIAVFLLFCFYYCFLPIILLLLLFFFYFVFVINAVFSLLCC